MAEEIKGKSATSDGAASVEADGSVPASAAGVLAEAPVATPKKAKNRSMRAVPSGIAYIKATFNNTMVSITDAKGAVIAWSSAGRTGMKGSRKSTAFAAALVGQDVARQAVGRGMHELEVRVQGAGAGRESAIRALQSAGLNVTVIKDVTPIPHNGCRPRKRRRV
jgi:small subunit ribosomal protein S11